MKKLLTKQEIEAITQRIGIALPSQAEADSRELLGHTEQLTAMLDDCWELIEEVALKEGYPQGIGGYVETLMLHCHQARRLLKRQRNQG